jgi:hypothetical protein
MLTGFTSLDTVYITASLPYILTPGLLCRQMLSEFGGPALRFVLFAGDVEEVHFLADLYPHAPLYRRVNGAAVVAHAAQFVKICEPIDSAAAWSTIAVPSAVKVSGVAG